MVETIISVTQLIFGIIIAVFQNLFKWDGDPQKVNENSKIAKNFKNIITGVLLVFMVILSFFKDWYTRHSAAESKMKQEAQHKADLNDVALKIQDQFTRSLAEYGLEYKRVSDSAGQVIQKLINKKDFGSSMPALTFPPDGLVVEEISSDSIRIATSLHTTTNPAVSLGIKFYLLYYFIDKTWERIEGNDFKFSKGVVFQPNYSQVIKGTAPTNWNGKTLNWVIVLVKGEYSNIEGTKINKINEIRGLQVGKNTYGNLLMSSFELACREVFRKNGIPN